MQLSEHFIWVINVSVIALLTLWVGLAYKLRSQKLLLVFVYGIASMILAWLFAWLTSSLWMILPSNAITKLLATTRYLKTLNHLVWFLIILILFVFSSYFIQRKYKLVIPWQPKKWMEHAVNIVFAACMMTMTILIFVLFLSSPVFANGKTLLERSWLSPFASLGDSLIDKDSTIGLITQTDVIQKIIDEQPLTQEDLDQLNRMLINVGLSTDVSAVIIKVVVNQPLQTTDNETLNQYVMDAGLTDEDVIDLLNMFRLPESKTIEYMRVLGFSQQAIDDFINKRKR